MDTKEFVSHAIGLDGWGGVVQIFNLYFPRMQELARELLNTWRVEGWRVRENLRVGSLG